MRVLRALTICLVLVLPVTATAAENDADWYLHVDLKQMRSEDAGNVIYTWLQDEVFDDIQDESGIDVRQELDSITAFSVAGSGPVIVFEGEASQATIDKIMALLAADGSDGPYKASGKRYFRFGEEYDEAADADQDRVRLTGSKDLGFNIALEEGAWISTDLKNAVVVTATEDQMKQLLADNGKVAMSKRNKGSLILLTADKALLQASMNSDAMDDEWDSNLLRNTEQVAFMLAAASGKVAIEAKLITTEPEMAESLASVARGLISLASFDDSMPAGAAAMLRDIRIEANDNSLDISLAVDPALLVRTLDD